MGHRKFTEAQLACFHEKDAKRRRLPTIQLVPKFVESRETRRILQKLMASAFSDIPESAGRFFCYVCKIPIGGRCAMETHTCGATKILEIYGDYFPSGVDRSQFEAAIGNSTVDWVETIGIEDKNDLLRIWPEDLPPMSSERGHEYSCRRCQDKSPGERYCSLMCFYYHSLIALNKLPGTPVSSSTDEEKDEAAPAATATEDVQAPPSSGGA